MSYRKKDKAPGDEAWIKAVKPDISPPSLEDNTADADRLIRSLRKLCGGEQVSMDLETVRGLPRLLRQHDYDIHVMVYRNWGAWHIIDVLPSSGFSGLYGLAMDLGTSTVVLRLLDLLTGQIIDETSFHNPQIQFGADILTRIHFATQGNGLSTLQGLLINRLNEEITRIEEYHGIPARSIAGMAFAGNTTMTHFFLGLDPFQICREPYIPAVNKPDLVKSPELGLKMNSRAPVLAFPNVGSYFGGDLVAGILASGLNTQDDISFLVDVGTNAEVVIGNREWLMGCAGAAGPALEGGVASMGMMAGPGVIDRVEIEGVSSDFKVRTIDGLPAIGICGSGLIDLAAQMFQAGMIDMRGKFVPEACGERLRSVDGMQTLIVVEARDSGTGEPLIISQADIDGLIRSKAAMYTILTTISNTVGIPLKDIGRFYIAGTFGSYIDPVSAITIGMIPDLPVERYVSLGNTSIQGASMSLLSGKHMADTFEIRDRITYMELNVNQEFMNLFSAAKFIPHTDRSLFPNVQGPVAH